MKQLKTWPGVLDLDTLEILKLKIRWDNTNTQYLDSRHWSASAVVHPHPIPRTRLMCWVNYRSFLYFPTALPFFCIFIIVLRDVRCYVTLKTKTGTSLHQHFSRRRAFVWWP